MTFKFAIFGIALLAGISQCKSFWFDEGAEQYKETTAVSRPDTHVEESDEEYLISDMINYIVKGNDLQEGRKKKFKKKLMKYVLIGMLVKLLLLPKILAIVKFLTAKAYGLALLALVMATTGSKKRSQDHESEQVKVINLVPKGREKQPHNLVYRYWERRSLESEPKS